MAVTTQSSFFKLPDSAYRKLIPLKPAGNHNHAEVERKLAKVRVLDRLGRALLDASGLDQAEMTVVSIPGFYELTS